jgi:hypothetical protein
VTQALLRVVTALSRAPALHFLALGGLLFLITSTSAAPTRARAPIVITAERVAEIRDEYARTMATPPTEAELEALVAKEADDEMLYREALLLGLDRGDRAVEWRVIEKMEFLDGEADGDNAAALRRGLELGLHRDDVVVRSGLVTKMRLLAKGTSRSEEPVGEALEGALEAYLERNRDEYTQAERFTLTHVFLRGDASDAALDAEARALRATLEASATPPGETVRHGDPFVTGSFIRATPRAGLVKIFGDAFADAVTKLEAKRWSEPIRSPYGVHLVWLAEKQEAKMPTLESVRSQVLQAYRAERQEQYAKKMMEEIRRAYEVRVEKGAPSDG